MVDDLLRTLGEYKTVEYRIVDFNADKTMQYEAEEKRWRELWKYSSGDVDLFGPEETTATHEDVEEAQRKTLVEKVKSEGALKIIQTTAGKKVITITRRILVVSDLKTTTSRHNLSAERLVPSSRQNQARSGVPRFIASISWTGWKSSRHTKAARLMQSGP